MTFDDAFDQVLGHEGGYVNDPNDPGGETKFGISKRAFPAEDIPNLTEERARFLAKRDYWGPAGCDCLPPPLRYPLFDLAYHSGPRTAIRLLQKAVRETPDGILGPLTLQAVQSAPWERVALRLFGFKLRFQASLPNWPSHGRGWTRRNGDLLLYLGDYHA